MAEIGAYDAKTRLPELLRQVRKGKRFTITHRGEPIAELVPSRPAGHEEARSAIDALLRFELIRNVAPEELAAWVKEGRK